MGGSGVLGLDQASHFGEDPLGGSQLLVLGSQRIRDVLLSHTSSLLQSSDRLVSKSVKLKILDVPGLAHMTGERHLPRSDSHGAQQRDTFPVDRDNLGRNQV